jgi:hypothetical protein
VTAAVFEFSDEDPIMTYTSISGLLSKLASRVITSNRLIALAMIVTLTSVAMQPAHAQSADTWKSIAIIGGSTAAGAYVGHKVAGPTGAWIGAGIGATASYAIDRRRRANEYYNSSAGYYDPNGGYYGNGGYYENGGYRGGPYAGAPFPGGLQYQSHNDSAYANTRGFSPRSSR